MSITIDEIRQTVEILFEPSDVAELRAFKDGAIKSGYFDDHELLAQAATGLHRHEWQIFVTLNPVDAAVLDRHPNRVQDRPTATTSDGDVAERRWLLVDVDPVRPAGVCATLGEKTAAYHKTRDVRDHLRVEGWPEPVIADSGNGFHLLYRVDLPNNPESKKLVKAVLEALASEFDDDGSKVDAAVHNAARLVRLYGTTNAKGANTPERPHRRSVILKVADEEA